MRGYPKKLNTKADYEYVRENFAEDEWKKDWKALLDTEKDWFVTGKLDSKEAGITDATHKVVSEGEEDEESYVQMELKIVPNCKLLRLGFTEEEVKAVVGA